MRFRSLSSTYLTIPTTLLLLAAGPAAATTQLAHNPATSPIIQENPEDAAVEATQQHATTSPVEASRVDTVDVSGFAWGDCPELPGIQPPDNSTTKFSCATLDVPLNYSDHDAGTYTLFIKKAHATGDASKKKGALFVNPGGPGSPSASYVNRAIGVFPSSITESFDVIGIDPRGVGGKPATKCLQDPDEAEDVAAQLQTPPRTEEARAKYVAVADHWAQACHRPENKIVKHVSTANVARDMDVVRRAVGDEKLTYHGLSYGTILGQQYAALFPDRFRAIAIDGVLDPTDWVGSRHNAHQNVGLRLGSAAGAEGALKELLDRCDKVGPNECEFAAANPAKQSSYEAYTALLERVEKNPITMNTGELLGIKLPPGGPLPAKVKVGAESFTILTLSTVRMYFGTLDPIPAMGVNLTAALDARDADPEGYAASTTNEPSSDRPTIEAPEQAVGASRGLPVICADTKLPSLEHGIDQALASSREYPVFGPRWGTAGLACGSKNWKPNRSGAYVGPFYKRTAVAPLVVGNLWDPATNHSQAVKVARRTPNAYFLSSDNWGHTSFGTSDCADNLVANYLLTGKAPRHSTCTGDYQPFTTDAGTQRQQQVAEIIEPLGGVSAMTLRGVTTN